ncbi:MAG: hypothetical protein EON93_26385, partial [Burkholderiales bacterium]
MTQLQTVPGPHALARTSTTSASAPTTLLGVLRDPHYYPLFRALLSDQVSKLNMPSALYFTYSLEGDDVIANQVDVDTVLTAIGSAIGNPNLRAMRRLLRGREAEITMVLSPKAKAALLAELAALLA